MAVILTIAAVICLIVAVVFAFTQCSSQKNDNKASTAPSTEQVTTVHGDDNYVPVYTEEPTYEPPTEYQPETEAPVQTEPQTEYQPETEPQQSSDISVTESSQTSDDTQPTQSYESGGDEPYVEEN